MKVKVAWLSYHEKEVDLPLKSADPKDYEDSPEEFCEDCDIKATEWAREHDPNCTEMCHVFTVDDDVLIEY